MSYPEKVTEDIRLRVLQALSASPEYTQPESAVLAALESVGHRISETRLISESAWLGETGLLLRQPVGAIAILTLTPRGLDVASGREVFPGVARPRPGE